MNICVNIGLYRSQISITLICRLNDIVQVWKTFCTFQQYSLIQNCRSFQLPPNLRDPSFFPSYPIHHSSSYKRKLTGPDLIDFQHALPNQVSLVLVISISKIWETHHSLWYLFLYLKCCTCSLFEELGLFRSTRHCCLHIKFHRYFKLVLKANLHPFKIPI